MDKYNYTIIIPHKNIPDLLQRCLNSIPQREDIQIIIIDDNSDPSIVDFKNFPGLNRKNTEIYFTKEGKGAGYARNVGLKHAQGKWLLFADADDFFTENFTTVIDQHFNEKADIIFFLSKSVDNITLEKVKSRIDLSNNIKRKKFNKIKYTNAVPWGKLINRKFIENNNIFFGETSVANDILFSVTAGIKSSKVIGYLQCIYISTIRRDSLFHKNTIERLKTRIQVCKETNRLYYTNQIYHYHLIPYRINQFELIKQIKQISISEYKTQIKLYFQEESWMSIIQDFSIYYIKKWIKHLS